MKRARQQTSQPPDQQQAHKHAKSLAIHLIFKPTSRPKQDLD